MLDANDIQTISQIVSEAIKENNKAIHADMMTIVESEINPKLQLLAEGQEVLLEKINRLEKRDELTGRVVILEEAVKRLNKDVDALKKAQ